MPLSTLNNDLNDAFETYFPSANPVAATVKNAISFAIVTGMRFRTWAFRGRRLMNERIVEYPQILQWIEPEGAVLDIGCCSSRLPMQLASLGYDAHGLDVREYPFSHPNFSFHREDIFRWEPPCQFDVILMVSTMEHFGLGVYEDERDASGDAGAIARVREWLRPGGQLLVSVPFGKRETTDKHRVYDRPALQAVFEGFDWHRERYFGRNDERWVPLEASALADRASSGLPVNGVAVLDLRKSEADDS